MASEFFTAEPPGKTFNHTMNMKVLVSQLCLTLCNPMGYSLPGSSVHGILQARILEWVAIPFSGRSSLPRDWTWVSCIAGQFFTIWAIREALYKWHFLLFLLSCFHQKQTLMSSSLHLRNSSHSLLPQGQSHKTFWALCLFNNKVSSITGRLLIDCNYFHMSVTENYYLDKI